MATKWVVNFPTLGDLWDAWVFAHCRVPDGYRRGEPFEWSDWQFWCFANLGRIREGLKWEGEPLRSQAFHYRRAQIMGPQKTGKGPAAASIVAVMAVGPSEFDGWAQGDEVYKCSDWGCGCGFEYFYEPGEPMGRPHPSPLIQLTATSEDQVDNTYRPLRSMIELGPLSERLADREGFIRILGGEGGDKADRIDVVTSSATSRVGNPVSFVLQDETGLWTKRNRMMAVADAQRRGAAGMGGRTLETTNAYDSSENSVAQRTYLSTVEDVFKFYEPPPKGLKWSRKADRRKILEHVYTGSPWVPIDGVLAEANELSETDPDQAERFFGNKITYSAGAWLPDGIWEGAYDGMDA